MIQGKRQIDLLALCLVLLIAVTIRSVYFLEYRANVPYYSCVIVDSYYYDLWAQRVAEGKGYGKMPYYMAPLYPYILAGIYKLFGHNIPLVYVLQLLLGVVNTVLVFAISRRLFGLSPAVIASLFLTFYGPLIYLEPKIMTETLFITLGLVSMYLLLQVLESPNLTGAFCLGLTLGLSAICRPVALITALLFLLTSICKHWKTREGIRISAVALLGIVVTIAPVSLRNYVVGDDLVLISSNGGIVFAQGNNPSANGVSGPLPGFSGSIGTQREEEMEIAQKTLGHTPRASESSAFWVRQSLRFASEKPGKFAILLLRKIIWSLHAREARCSYNFYLEQELVPILRFLVLPFPLIFGFAFFGLVRGRGKGFAVAVYAFSIFVGLVLFSVSSRYRVPMVPALAIFAGFGMKEVIDALRRRNMNIVGQVGLCLLVAFLPSLVPYPIPAITPEGPANLGVSYFSLGKPEHAIYQLKRAVSLAPDYSYARNKLGEVLASQGRLGDAIAQFSAIIAQDAKDALAHRNLGVALSQMGQMDEGATELKKALSLQPRFADAHRRLGRILAKQGKSREAMQHYKAAVSLDPDNADLHFEFGLLLQRVGAINGATSEYRKALDLRPDFADAHNNLAVALYFKGDYDGAWEHLKLAERCGFRPNPAFTQALFQRMHRSR